MSNLLWCFQMLPKENAYFLNYNFWNFDIDLKKQTFLLKGLWHLLEASSLNSFTELVLCKDRQNITWTRTLRALIINLRQHYRDSIGPHHLSPTDYHLLQVWLSQHHRKTTQPALEYKQNAAYKRKDEWMMAEMGIIRPIPVASKWITGYLFSSAKIDVT